MRPLAVPPESNCIDALNPAAVLMNDSLATPMSGNYCRPVVAVLVNGPTVSACSVERSVAACVGSGTRKTMYGQRCIRSTRDDGFMSTHAKRHGINHVSTPRVSYSRPFDYKNGQLTVTGWGRKIAYCVAFSIEGATDVTRRYVRSPAKHGAHRNRAPEEVLLWVIHEIRNKRRQELGKTDQKRLIKEDEREERELRAYMAAGLAADINNMFPLNQTADEQKRPMAHQEATAEWQPGGR